jgi:hypothetical protein
MIKTIFATSLVLFGLIFSECFGGELITFEQAKQNIFQNLDDGNYAEVNLAYTELKAQFSKRQELPETF